jgi:hypothetical protein
VLAIGFEEGKPVHADFALPPWAESKRWQASGLENKSCEIVMIIDECMM